MKIILNWLLFAVVIAAIYFGWKYIHITLPVMPWYLVLLFSLSLAFTWVEVLKWGSVKPFNCLKCLTGWFAIALAFLFHTEFWYFYLFSGLFLGSIFSLVKGRL